MLRIAVVEDDDRSANTICSYVERAEKQLGVALTTSRFRDGIEFLTKYKADFDMVFMDIEMPDLDGVETARRLRKSDRQVAIVFITNMSQFALSGYEVNALDFIIKPVSYADFVYRLEKVLALMRPTAEEEIMLKFDRDIVRLRVSDITYVEVVGHNVVYHTVSGGGVETFAVHQSLAKVEKQLEGKGFSKCNSNYLVNLKYVRGVSGDEVNVSGEKLQMSRSRRKPFIDALTTFVCGGNG